MLDPTKKKISHVGGQRRSPNKMVGGAKLRLESNLIPTTEIVRGLKQPDVPLSIGVSPAEAWISSGLLRGQGLWLQQTWEARHVV